MFKVLRSLFASRKFQVALGSLAVVILVQLGMEEDKANQITTAAIVVATAVIGGIAFEDGSAKFKAGKGATRW